MGKNNVVHKNKMIDEDDEVNFSDFLDDLPFDEDDDSAQTIDMLMSANNMKMKCAVELTRIAVQNTQEMSVDGVFSTFKKATEVINETFPLNGMIDKMLENQ